MAADSAEQLDAFLLQSFERLAKQRELDTTAAWLASLRERTPEPSFFAFGPRRDWRAAFAEVARIPVEHLAIDALFVPTWICNHLEDSSNDEWLPETMLVSADGKLQCFDGHLAHDRVIAVRIDRVQRGYVERSRSYAASVRNRLYNAHHIVLVSEGAERVLSVHGSAEAPTVPRPTRELPPWTTEAIAAVELRGLSALGAQIGSSSGDDYRAARPRPDWPSLVEAALALQCSAPLDEEELAELTR